MVTPQDRQALDAFLEDQRGVTAIEYALLAALIFGAIVVSVGLLGDSVRTLYDEIAVKVAAAIA